MVTRLLRGGLTLLETVIASFLLLMGILVAFEIFDSAIRFQTRTEIQSEASLAAEDTFEEIAAWNCASHYPAGSLNFDDWSFYDGRTFAYSQNSAITLSINCTAANLSSPCSSFESVYLSLGSVNLGGGVSLANNSVQLSPCFEQVVLHADWGLGSANWTRFYAPPSGQSGILNPVVVITDAGGSPAGSTSLHHDEILTLQAKLQDASGRSLDGATFTWSVLGPGNGILVKSRDGHLATFTNLFIVKTRHVYLDNQQCTIQAQARYMGYSIKGLSGAITLVP